MDVETGEVLVSLDGFSGAYGFTSGGQKLGCAAVCKIQASSSDSVGMNMHVPVLAGSQCLSLSISTTV